MALNYEEFSNKTRSQKITLCTIEAKHQRKVFTGGPVYSASSSYYVCGVTVDGIDLVKTNNTPAQGQYRYNPTTGVVELRLVGNANPSTKRVFFKYRFFFSSIPVTIGTTFSDNYDVYWEPRITGEPSLRLELDSENTGTVLETSSQLSLENTDGYFDEIFDRFIWEGQIIKAYSWSESLDVTEIKIFYQGKIDSKSFTDKSVTFNIKDQVSDLREKVPYSVFSANDGRVADSDLNKPKRKIFGRVEKVKTTGIDKVLDGYPVTGTLEGSADRNLLTGTVSGILSSTQINGTGTLFLSQINAGDEILIKDGILEYTYTVQTVNSNTLLTITSPITAAFTGAKARNKAVKNNKVFGTGTNFKQIFSPDDEIITTVDQVQYSYRIEEVVSNTELTLSDEIQRTFTSLSIKPSVPYRGYNRRWHIAGHKLRSVTHTVAVVIDNINFELDSVAEFFEGDTILINTEYRKITRITGLKIRINQSLDGVLVGDTVTKIPVPVVYIEKQPLLFGRDYSIVNTTSDCYVDIDPLAEFNNAKNKSLSISFQFTNNSDIVTTVSNDRDLTTILKPRDWIRSTNINHQIWYEILSVEPLQFRLRVSYAGASFQGQLSYRAPDYISDSSLITADCIGMEWNGKWIKTPADTVLQMLESVDIQNIDSQSFDNASIDCDYTMSLALPETLGSEMPNLRDAITLVNKSCFGSLYFNPEFEFTYKILNSSKPENLKAVKDDDILGFSVQTRNQILGTVRLNYRPFVDQSTGSETFNQVTVESDFVEETSGIRKEEIFTSYIYDEEDARTIAERWAFFRSLSQSSVRVQAKLNFMLTSLNEPVFLDLERLFVRYGGNGRKKIGIVNAVDKDGDSTSVTFNDLGNIFNRVPAICPDLQSDYSLADVDEIAKYGFVVDNNTETPDITSELDLGNNLIG
jgi:hypothetical protein